MTFRVEHLDLALAGSRRRVQDYLELSKPRLVFMILVTAFAGFFLGAGENTDYLLLVPMLTGTALSAAGTLALNQLMERQVDGRMERTRRRPLPGGRVQPIEALLFGFVTVTLGLMVLAVEVDALSALITAFITTTYLLIYTPLKQKTSLCSVVGAVPGALPPLIGWAVAAGGLGVEAWTLFGILFLWQISHNLAIAWLYRDDFARGGIKFLPVIDPEGLSTGRHVVGHSLALLVVSLMPTMLGLAGVLYFIVAISLGLSFLSCSFILAIFRTEAAARRLLMASLIYLPVLLLVMALDRVPLM